MFLRRERKREAKRILTGHEDGDDMATPLGPGDGLQPDVVLRGASELSHGVGGRCWTQHHLLGQPKHTKTKLIIKQTRDCSLRWVGGGVVSSHPDHTIGGEGEGVASDSGLRWFPSKSSSVRLYVDGLQISRRVYIWKCNVVLCVCSWHSWKCGVRVAPTGGEFSHSGVALQGFLDCVDSNLITRSRNQRSHLKLHRVPRNLLHDGEHCGTHGTDAG